MGKQITAGTYPVHNNLFEVKTSAAGAETDTWSEIAEMEEFTPAFEGNVETWSSMGADGWQSALSTGKAWSIELKGKRYVGDPGNDYIASKMDAVGQDAYADVRWTLPNGVKVEGQAVVDVTNCGGKSTDVGPLEFKLQGNGKPTVTTPEA